MTYSIYTTDRRHFFFRRGESKRCGAEGQLALRLMSFRHQQCRRRKGVGTGRAAVDLRIRDTFHILKMYTEPGCGFSRHLSVLCPMLDHILGLTRLPHILQQRKVRPAARGLPAGSLPLPHRPTLNSRNWARDGRRRRLEILARDGSFCEPNIRRTPQRACKMLPSRSLFRLSPAPGLSRAVSCHP